MKMMKNLKDANLTNKRVIIRADLDVPIKDGKVTDDYRLRALLPTLRYITEQKAIVMIVGHAGRPKGRKDPSLSLRPVSIRLSELFGKEFTFFDELRIPGGLSGLAMFENLRFWPGEEKNSLAFAKKLSSLGDVFVNDAFAVSHRGHASIVGVAEILPAYAGLRLAQEVKELGGVLENPERPLIFIIGGAKSETKAPLVPAFAQLADKVLLGGLLMFHNELEDIPNVVFPPDASDAYDIGPQSVKLFTQLIKDAGTVVWNGPLGMWEDNRYELATRAIAEELAILPAKTIVGGGDTIAALSAFGLLKDMKYVSLGGGAMLEFLSGKELPGLRVLGYYKNKS